MVKTLILIFAAAIFVGFIEAKMTQEEFAKRHMEHMQKCLPESGLTEEHAKDGFKGGVPTTKVTKCFVACLLKENGELKNGKYDIEGVRSYAKLILDEGTPPYQSMMDAAQKCEAEVNKTPESDECEMAGKIVATLTRLGGNAGIE